MDKFTFEAASTPLETYEWDNTWIAKSGDKETPRIFYIGDSISCGNRGAINRISEGKLLCDGFGTSKALDNEAFLPAVKLFASQIERYDVVFFNNGLHGWHLDDETEYFELYDKFVSGLLEFFGGAKKLVILMTTNITNDKELAKRVPKRNAAAIKVAEKYSLPCVDLYGKSLEIAHLQSGDGVHFTPEGYEELSRMIIEFAENFI